MSLINKKMLSLQLTYIDMDLSLLLGDFSDKKAL